MSINETKEFISLDIDSWLEDQTRDRAVIFILGETGNGKTQLIQQVGNEKKMEMIELNLGNALDPTELTGCRIPVLEKDGEYTLKLALLNEIKEQVNKAKPFILFIDELGAEQPQMRNFLLKLFAERSLNGVKLNNAYIICAGNPPGNYKTTPLEPALRARVSQVFTVATAQEVSEHFEHKAKKHTGKMGESYEIVASFLRRFPTSFGGVDGEKQDSNNPIRCARAYEFCVHSIYTYALKSDKANFLRHNLSGILGPATGADLSKFAKEGSKGIFGPEDILNGSFTDPKDHAKWADGVENLMRWLEAHNIKPTSDNFANITKFISYGKPDQITGFRRSLEQGIKWKIDGRVLGKLEAKLDAENLGNDYIKDEEEGVVASDAKKTTTTTKSKAI